MVYQKIFCFLPNSELFEKFYLSFNLWLLPTKLVLSFLNFITRYLPFLIPPYILPSISHNSKQPFFKINQTLTCSQNNSHFSSQTNSKFVCCLLPQNVPFPVLHHVQKSTKRISHIPTQEMSFQSPITTSVITCYLRLCFPLHNSPVRATFNQKIFGNEKPIQGNF